MPKYYPFRIADHYLYFTSECIVEAMHVHASDKKLTEANSAKFFVKSDGSTVLQKHGDLNSREINVISRFIKENYLVMYAKWSSRSNQGFFGE